MQIFETRDAALDAAYHITAEALYGALKKGGRAGLLLSGGSTPGPLYERLSHEDLDWHSIKVGLVDERWVDEDDKGSNGDLVRRTLLQNAASKAVFWRMKTRHKTAESGMDNLNQTYDAFKDLTNIVILGMGPDGHTASWFPGSDGLEHALKTQHMVAAIQARKSAVTGDYLERATLSRAAVAQASTALLVIFGDAKRDVYNQALSDSSLPVHYAIKDLGDRLHVLWAP